MEIKKVDINSNNIILLFDEIQGQEIVEKVLEYLVSQELGHYYFYYDDSFGNYDISCYYKDYPILLERPDVGCFEINTQHIKDITFMFQILNQYHYSCLYINSDPNFLRYTDCKYRVQNFPTNVGYTLNMETFSGYMHIHKANDMPDWDLAKIGISEEMLIKDVNSTGKDNSSKGIFSFIKKLFSGS